MLTYVRLANSKWNISLNVPRCRKKLGLQDFSCHTQLKNSNAGPFFCACVGTANKNKPMHNLFKDPVVRGKGKSGETRIQRVWIITRKLCSVKKKLKNARWPIYFGALVCWFCRTSVKSKVSKAHLICHRASSFSHLPFHEDQVNSPVDEHQDAASEGWEKVDGCDAEPQINYTREVAGSAVAERLGWLLFSFSDPLL